MGNEVRKPVLVECEHVVRVVEERVESFMLLEDGEGPLELHDGVQSVLIGSIAGKTVQITIHVQPGLSDEYWQSLPGRCPTSEPRGSRSTRSRTGRRQQRPERHQRSEWWGRTIRLRRMWRDTWRAAQPVSRSASRVEC